MTERSVSSFSVSFSLAPGFSPSCYDREERVIVQCLILISAGLQPGGWESRSGMCQPFQRFPCAENRIK